MWARNRIRHANRAGEYGVFFRKRVFIGWGGGEIQRQREGRERSRGERRGREKQRAASSEERGQQRGACLRREREIESGQSLSLKSTGYCLASSFQVTVKASIILILLAFKLQGTLSVFYSTLEIIMGRKVRSR